MRCKELQNAATVMRIARIQGLAAHLPGSTLIRSNCGSVAMCSVWSRRHRSVEDVWERLLARAPRLGAMVAGQLRVHILAARSALRGAWLVLTLSGRFGVLGRWSEELPARGHAAKSLIFGWVQFQKMLCKALRR